MGSPRAAHGGVGRPHLASHPEALPTPEGEKESLGLRCHPTQIRPSRVHAHHISSAAHQIWRLVSSSASISARSSFLKPCGESASSESTECIACSICRSAASLTTLPLWLSLPTAVSTVVCESDCIRCNRTAVAADALQVGLTSGMVCVFDSGISLPASSFAGRCLNRYLRPRSTPPLGGSAAGDLLHVAKARDCLCSALIFFLLSSTGATCSWVPVTTYIGSSDAIWGGVVVLALLQANEATRLG